MHSREELNSITGRILDASFAVHTALGPGLLEATYERCLAYKLAQAGLQVAHQQSVPLQFEDLRISDAYRIDILVEESVVMEIKACEKLIDLHFAQVFTYLRALDLRVGLLINFNSVHLKQGIHRIVNKF
jgi:GxxExxY protein